MKVRFPLILSIMFSLQVFAAEYNSEATSIALNAKFDPNKYTVCSITINSDNEKKLFSRFIKDQNSKLSKLPESKKKDLTSYNEEILELTSPELIGDSKENWFDRACEIMSKAKFGCDQLIVSGHFGGTFFGKSGLTLSFDEMEKHSCSNSCNGIMKQPMEVFLFGCNTLAPKAPKGRDLNQYFNVLTGDRVSNSAGNAEALYGVTGTSFKDRMRRIFSGGDFGNQYLYGNQNVGPTGDQVEAKLRNYLNQPEAFRHLKEMENNRFNKDYNYVNNSLMNSLSGTAITQASSCSSEDPTMKNNCMLFSSDYDDGTKLNTSKIFLSSTNYNEFLKYVPAVQMYLESNKNKDTNEYKNFLNEVMSNAYAKANLEKLFQEKALFATKYGWIKLAKNLNMITEDEFAKKVSSEIKLVLKNEINIGIKDAICSSQFKVSEELKKELLNSKLINKKNLNTGEGKSALACLGIL